MFNKHATCPFNSDMSHVIKNKYMLKDFLRTKMLWRRVCKGTLCSGYMAISLLAMAACSDNYEWAQDKPAWLGESIYDELQKRGNFSIYLKMADDLGRTDFLKKTGCRRWYQKSKKQILINRVKSACRFYSVTMFLPKCSELCCLVHPRQSK